jgi:hypothetical protein
MVFEMRDISNINDEYHMAYKIITIELDEINKGKILDAFIAESGKQSIRVYVKDYVG